MIRCLSNLGTPSGDCCAFGFFVGFRLVSSWFPLGFLLVSIQGDAHFEKHPLPRDGRFEPRAPPQPVDDSPMETPSASSMSQLLDPTWLMSLRGVPSKPQKRGEFPGARHKPREGVVFLLGACQFPWVRVPGEVGAGYKTFKRSQLVFLPLEPRPPGRPLDLWELRSAEVLIFPSTRRDEFFSPRGADPMARVGGQIP